jgi:hypothetical protein
MSIADTGRFCEILVIPVLQILEDSEKYWLYQYSRYWKILENTGYTYTSIADTGRLGTKLRNVLVYCFFCPVCASVMRGRTVYRETGRKETKGERKEKRGRKKREGRNVKRGGRNEKRGGRINSPMIKQDM